MARITNLFSLLLFLVLSVSSCQKERTQPEDAVSPEIIDKVARLGFNPDGIVKIDEGYLVERDIILTEEILDGATTDHRVPGLEQYRTTNVVTVGSGREITIYAPQGGSTGYSPGMIAGLDLAIARYNAEGLRITFRRVASSSGADIVMTRLRKGEERQGILGSAGFPTSSGDPYNQIKMSGILESTYGLSTAGIATIIAHEMGHCIGFRHTDYFDRSISCGGGPSNEGPSTVGAIHISGTPTGASLAAKSWMLSCTNGGDRPFNGDDQIALSCMYSGSSVCQ